MHHVALFEFAYYELFSLGTTIIVIFGIKRGISTCLDGPIYLKYANLRVLVDPIVLDALDFSNQRTEAIVCL